VKWRLFATSGIAEFWLIDADNQSVIVHRDPIATGYQVMWRFGLNATIAPLAAPDCQLDLGWLFR
jgi:Uma2 family endonuclease